MSGVSEKLPGLVQYDNDRIQLVCVLVPVPRAAEAKTGTWTCYRLLLSLEEVSVGDNVWG